MVVLGASILSGWGLSYEESVVAQLSQRAKLAGVLLTVDNQAIAGAHSGNGIAQIGKTSLVDPDVILIGLGLGDVMYGFPNHKIEGNLSELIELVKLSYQGSKIILVQGMIFQQTHRELPAVGSKEEIEYRLLFSNLAKKHNIYLVEPLYQNIYHQNDFMQADQIHANKKGCTRIAAELWEQIKEII